MNFFDAQPAVASLREVLVVPGRENEGRNRRVQFFPPRVIEWNRLELGFKDWPLGLNGLRIVHLSDFHLRRRWPAVMDLVLKRICSNLPGLVLLTGDFVDNKRNHRPGMPQVRRLVETLGKSARCFAIHGNHDNYKIGAELRDSGVTFLDGLRSIAKLTGGEVELIGLPGKHRVELTRDFLSSIPERNPGVPRIVLSHFPDHLKRTGGLDADLFLAGHTHGGQICLPGGRPIIWHDGLPRKMSRGAHRVGKTWLVVNRGFGYTGIPLRTYAAPEAIEIICHADAPK